MNSGAQLNGTQIDEIADGLFRVHTPVSLIPGGFSFNQYLYVMNSPFYFTRAPDHSFRRYVTQSPRCYRWKSCTTSAFHTLKATNAVHSTSFLWSHHTQGHCAAGLPRWYR